jgi:hypothetical protein
MPFKHWDDHMEANKTGVEWSAQDLQSKNKIRKLLAGEPLDAFGLGSARTLEEFEEYLSCLRIKRHQGTTSRKMTRITRCLE